MDPVITPLLIIAVFVLGYLAIIFEFHIKVNKTAVAIFIAVICWMIYFVSDMDANKVHLTELGHYLSDISQILFFLMGAMTLVELIDTHKGFNTVIRLIRTRKKRLVLVIIAILSFFLSSVLDNLTTSILMVSILRKLVPHRKERFILCCMVVIAANAGGAWTPIGDVTTTMLWINGQVSTFGVIKAIFVPSVVAMLLPLGIYAFQLSGEYSMPESNLAEEEPEPGATLVFVLGVASLIFVPVFKWLTGMPPFMGVLIGLSVLWLVTDVLHYKYEHRQHLRIPVVLTRIDTSAILFFLGILLAIDALTAANILEQVARWLDAHVRNDVEIATAIGLLSAIVDNVPLVAATMGMYDIAQYPIDSQLWLITAFTAGTGGSILIIGSSAGVAIMGIEKIDFIAYMKKAALPALVGYFGGIAVYLLL
ncbi:MAG: sodium:proton antiporter NhaD [Simkaniaceae bacterium]|nr:sodium:proton antiporter NhaD [Simkaniaceae bacterium]